MVFVFFNRPFLLLPNGSQIGGIFLLFLFELDTERFKLLQFLFQLLRHLLLVGDIVGERFLKVVAGFLQLGVLDRDQAGVVGPLLGEVVFLALQTRPSILELFLKPGNTLSIGLDGGGVAGHLR